MMNSRISLGIVIPAKDEREQIVSTLRSLMRQVRVDNGEPLTGYEIVAVENGSTDNTFEVVAEFASSARIPVTVFSGCEPSAIAARIQGVRYLLDRESPAAYLVSCDADTLYPDDWLHTLWRSLQAGADVAVSAGYMDPVLWQRCPRLTTGYATEVGSIFFDPESIARIRLDEAECLFTRQVYTDFERPACSPGFGITAAAYERLGGFRREYYDAAGAQEILIAAWPLMFRAELTGMRVEQIEHTWWLTSPRRLVAEPEIQLGREFQHGEMEAFRGIPDSAFGLLDAKADTFDYHGLRLNCIRDYVLTPCILRPTRIVQNPQYFGSLAPELTAIIERLYGQGRAVEPRHIFDLARDLTAQYGEDLLDTLADSRTATRISKRP